MIKIKTWIVKAHFILLPFGGLDFGNSYLSVNFITSILLNLFFGLSFLKLLKFPDYRKTLLFLLFYWICLLSISILNFRTDVITAGSELRMLTLYVFTFLNLLYFFKNRQNELYICFNLLTNSIIVLSFLALLGWNVQYVGGSNRLSILGMNPNYVAYFIVFAFSFQFIKLLNSGILKLKVKIILTLALFISVFIKLGSLSALGLLIISIMVILMTRMRTISSWVKNFSIGLLVLIPVIFLISNSNIYSQRLNNKEELNDLSGRKGLWEFAIEQIAENPLLGIGFYESAYRRFIFMGVEISFHNVYLETLVTGGLLSLVFLLLFYLEFFKLSFNAINDYLKSLAISIFFISIISVFSGQFSFLSFSLPLVIVFNNSSHKQSQFNKLHY